MFFEDSEVIEDNVEETDYPPSEVDDYESSSSSGDDDDDQHEDEDNGDEESGFTCGGSELDPSSGDSSYDELDQSSDNSSYDEGCSKRRRGNTRPTQQTLPAAENTHAPKIPFTKESKFLPKLEKTPLSYFLHFVDDAFLRSVCEHTNSHAAAEHAARRRDGDGDGDGDDGQQETWRPLELDEFKVFIAIVLHASLGISTIYQDDYRFAPQYCRLLKSNMPLDRFEQILHHLHFCSRSLDLKDIAMASDIVDYFNNKMSTSYYPGRQLWINNSIVLWRGRMLCRERARRGFDDKHGLALDALTEPSTAVTLRVRLTPSFLELDKANGAFSKLVIENLLQGYLECGHSLYLDPFFCRVSVARWLLERRTYCTGLLCKMPRGCRTRLAEGEQATARRAGGVLVGSWRSGGKCSYLTTEWGTERMGSMRAPAAVSAFLRATRRERRDDMLRESPGGGLQLRWHKHVFLWLLHTLTRNAYVFYLQQCLEDDAGDGDAERRRRRGRLSFFEFRVKVSLAMLLVDDMDSDEDDDLDSDDDDRDNLDNNSGSESSRHL